MHRTPLRLIALAFLPVTAAAAQSWIPDASKAAIPNKPAAGRLHGKAFRVEKATLDIASSDAGSKRTTYFLKLRQGGDFFADYEFSFTLLTPKGQSIAGKQFIVDPRGVFAMPGALKEGNTTYPPVQGVMTTWKVPGKTFGDTDMMSKFTMRLEFAKDQRGDKLPGRIYLAMQDKEKSWVAGVFTAVVKKL